MCEGGVWRGEKKGNVRCAVDTLNIRSRARSRPGTAPFFAHFVVAPPNADRYEIRRVVWFPKHKVMLAPEKDTTQRGDADVLGDALGAIAGPI